MMLAKSHEARAMDNNRIIKKELTVKLDEINKEFITLFEEIYDDSLKLKKENEINKRTTGHFHLQKEHPGIFIKEISFNCYIESY
jgi:hypothetical protein